jgi:Cu2+-exporting ATPase
MSEKRSAFIPLGLVDNKIDSSAPSEVRTSPDESLIKSVDAVRKPNINNNSDYESVNYPVLNMTCTACAARIENTLRNHPGVNKADINYANSTLSIEFASEITSIQDIQKTVKSIGYDLLTDINNTENDRYEKILREKFTKLKINTIGAVILTIPVVILGMIFMDMPYSDFISWVLTTPVLLWFGKDFFINAYKQAKHLTTSMDTLVAMSTGTAYLYSVFNTVFPEYLEGYGLHSHVYFEASSVIISFILIGKLLEEKAKGNTSSAIKKLIGLQAKTAILIDDFGNHKEIRIEEVKVGNILLVKPGVKIPVDGQVVGGSSYVDESMMTGEPSPVLKSAKDWLYAGTINQKGSLKFRAKKVGKDTMLAHIIKSVQEAQGSKAPVQRLVDKIAEIFVPVIIIISIITFFVWMFFGGDYGLSRGMAAMVTVLIIACPCALGLATPTAIIVGIGKAAEKGILIKNAESLESAVKADTIVLDKTGTLTEGKPEIVEIFSKKNDESKLLILYSIEKLSEHPLAVAFANYFKHNQTVKIDEFVSITGKGVTAMVGNERYFAGSELLLKENKIPIDKDYSKIAAEWSNESRSIIWFADTSGVHAIIAVEDKIKSSTTEALAKLSDMGLEIYMLTGDNEATAKSIARKADITHYKSGVQPNEKADFIKELQADGKYVIMVGDGINDSTALAQADMSIAMGKGSDIAMDVAQMTIISSDLLQIPLALNISKQTLTTIKQNLFWAFIYNIIGVPIAAGVLYPFTGFMLNPMIAGAAMALSSVSVVTNSLRKR